MGFGIWNEKGIMKEMIHQISKCRTDEMLGEGHRLGKEMVFQVRLNRKYRNAGKTIA
jgi:hypothetical protein